MYHMASRMLLNRFFKNNLGSEETSSTYSLIPCGGFNQCCFALFCQPDTMQKFPKGLAFEPLSAQDEYEAVALKEMLYYVAEHSPFYRELFSTHRVAIGQIQGLKDLAILPFTTKSDMQERNWDFLCVPRSEIREYTATSGTMGKPVTISLTENDLQRLAYNEAQSFFCADGSADDVYQLALTLDRQFMAGMAYYTGIRRMGASLVRMGPGLPQMQWETIERLQTNSLVVVPSFLLAMADWAEEHRINPQYSTVKKAICIGESIRRSDFSLSVLGGQIEAKWPIKLYNTYAATELQTAFTECGAGMGGHHQPELIIVEIIDDEGSLLPDETPGEVVVTTLGVEGMPLLRYRTGDIAALYATPCSCGRNSRRLGPIIGRKGQVIKYRGTTLYPPAVFDVLNEASYVTGYIVEVFSGPQETDELRLHLHTTLPVDQCHQQLRSLLQSRLRVTPELQYHSSTDMQAMMMPEGSRKQVRFIDNRIKLS
jgi:phenylacetate-CoA ligase